MKWWIVLLALLVGIAIGIAYQRTQHTPIRVRVGDISQQALLNPQAGDIIQWVDNRGNLIPMPASIWDPYASPCDPKFPNECHVLPSAEGLLYAYKCPPSWKCDPDVPVGSDVVRTLSDERVVATSAPSEAHIGCNANNAVVVTPEPAPVSASLQGAIFWKGIGTATAWTLTMQAGVCRESTIDQAHRICTLVDNLQPNDYQYTATATACAATPSSVFNLRVTK